jgi:FKBP-type peptidyl-prolyl cis-trans isomerase (trigger factor)
MKNTQTNQKSYDTATIKNLEKSMVEIIASIPEEIWEKYHKQALKNINETITVPGFRKGMVPENILIAKVGERTINEEMAEVAIPKAYVEILIDNEIDAIGKPLVQITKLAKDNPLEFKVTTAIVPKFKLPDCKKLAREILDKNQPTEPKVTDKDVNEAILRIRKSYASHKDHDHEKMTTEEHEKAILNSLPEFNDEFVRTLGDFKDVEDFKNKAREIIGKNKEDEVKEKTRIKIADAIVHETKIELPEIMIESELDRTQQQFEQDTEKMGVKMDDYLKHAKKSLEDIRKEWRPYAEKKAKLQLILNAIATTEKIMPSKEEVDVEVNNIIEHYKEANREHATTYVETVLTNEKVFQWLEK